MVSRILVYSMTTCTGSCCNEFKLGSTSDVATFNRRIVVFTLTYLSLNFILLLTDLKLKILGNKNNYYLFYFIYFFTFQSVLRTF